ncbi:transcription factor UNE12-like isoform X1 [Phoenix dactylifera]|uniref:Transcription factor UNE12-like isoform X1 n=1 Tax=Phoenix dactylifera TaxID=42345 RepID=A0A8B7BF83_PHODC|nr:transcription factor UNE12-like isoform X1 [Phoenix dactylifera]
MADPPPPLPDGIADDVSDKIFSVPAYGGGDAAVAGMLFHLTAGDGTASVFPLGLSPRPEVPAKALCRERIVERTRVLQELVPGSHKVLSMSRLRVAGAVAQVVADIPLSSVEGKVGEGGGRKPVWDKWSNNGMEALVMKLMEDVGAAMQFLQSKALCIIPISIATTIYQSQHQNEIPAAKPEPNTPS